MAEVSSTRLYLGNLPRNATSADVEAHFRSYGAVGIAEIKLMNGFGFIEYTDPLDARDAVPAFHGSSLMGERLIVQFARGSRVRSEDSLPTGDPLRYIAPRPRRTPYQMKIANLPEETTWHDLKDFARQSGCDVVYSEAGRMGDGTGFVEFDTAADLKNALHKLHLREFKGRNVTCTEDFSNRHADVKPSNILWINGRPGTGKTVLQGLGGVGKTQVALEYALHHRDAMSGAAPWSEYDLRSPDASLMKYLGIKKVQPAQHEVYEIPGYLTTGDTRAYEAAFGDYCAELNFMDERHAEDLNLVIDREKTRTVNIASGKNIRTTGTTQASFNFQDENKKHDLEFHVLPRCIHNVVLGRAFLKLTRTFSNLANRVRRLRKRIVQGFRRSRLLFLGDSSPRFLGLVNGLQSSALADSGSSVLVLDESYARSLGLHILRGSDYQTRLVFADGSKAYTSGMVHGVRWQFGFGNDAQEHFLDFHVLRNAPAKVILSDSFLFENEAYSQYEHYLVDGEDMSECDGEMSFFAIDHDPEYEPQHYNTSSVEYMEYREQIMRNEFEDRFFKLRNQPQKETAQTEETERRRRWEEAHARAVAAAAAQSTLAFPPSISQPGSIPLQTPSPHQQSASSQAPMTATPSKPSLRLLARLKFRLKKS